MTAIAPTDLSPEPRNRAFLGFRAKFILVVGSAVLFDLILSGSIALWNVNQLSRDASAEIESGLTRASREYLENYLSTTAQRVEMLVDGITAEVSTLAESLQEMIDAPDVAASLSQTLQGQARFNAPLVYDAQGNWAQSAPGARSVTSVWGYLLEDGVPRPDVQAVIDQSALFDLFAPSFLEHGPPELQIYYVGPKTAPIFRTMPYTDQAQNFDALYPGHNEANFWDFFFPGIYEGWESWLADPSTAPANLVTETAPYVDAITGNLIVSFFHPLWSADRTQVAGMTGVDVTLEQLSQIIEDISIADTGFAVLATSGGNILAINPRNAEQIGLSLSNAEHGTGVTIIDRSLVGSTQPGIAALSMPTDDSVQFSRVVLDVDGTSMTYLVGLQRLSGMTHWDATGDIRQENMTLGFFVPEAEIYAALDAAKNEISTATSRIIRWQGGALFISLFVVLAAVFAISGRITAGLSALADAARRLSRKDYSVKVEVGARDEVGDVANAFNLMAREMRFHTEHLEHLVEDRTKDLERASAEILSLNKKLEGENMRLSTELDVARRVQMMVLPRQDEITAVKGYDIACMMEPADEVGGDYYDVLQSGGLIKIGIGDVTGHGLESGVFMLMVQSIARALIEQGVTDPRAFLAVLNRSIAKNLLRSDSDRNMTLAFLDIVDGVVTLSGQHEEVLVARLDGSVERIETMELGFPVGLVDEIEDFIDTRRIDLAPGETLILYTDGITEAEDVGGKFYGDQRLSDATARHASGSATAIRDGILAELRAYIGTQTIFDDITLVVIKKE